MADNGGLRYDDGKPRIDLIPPEFVFGLSDVLTQGAQKYAERNWERGMDYSRCFGSLMRHAWKFWLGEDVDAESGYHHMLHVAWNAMALFTYATRGIGVDDRYVQAEEDLEAAEQKVPRAKAKQGATMGFVVPTLPIKKNRKQKKVQKGEDV